MWGSLSDLLGLLSAHSSGDCWLRQARLVLHLWDLAKLDPDQFDRLVDQLAHVQRCLVRFLERLERHGLSEGQLSDLLHEAVEAEAHRFWPGTSDIKDDPWSGVCRDVVAELYLRSVEPHQIDQLLYPVFSEGDAQAVLDASKAPARSNWELARQIVALHYEGKAHAEVARAAGVSYTTVKTVLAKLGEVPRASEVRVEGRAVRQRVRRFRAEHPNATWKDIARHTGATENQIRNALRGTKLGEPVRRRRPRGPAA